MKFFIHRKQTTASTQNDLIELAEKEELPEGYVIVADGQSEGKGQGTNKWETQDGKNLTFSFLLKPDFLAVERQFDLMQALSLGVLDFVRFHLDDEVFVKWPNDIYIGKKKLCGCLINNRIIGCSFDSVYCGIGLNVNQREFYHAPNPTSLCLHAGYDFDLNVLLNQLLECLFQRYEQLKSGKTDSIKAEYLNHLLYKDVFAEYIYKGNRVSAKAIDVNPYGYLILEKENGEKIEAELKELVFIHG